MTAAKTAHDFTFTAMDGKAVPLARYAGTPVLIVNTASECGLTPQYAGLEALNEAYGPRGLTVIGVPCNDFGAQEPGTEAQIKTFCERNYGVKFLVTRKEKVVGDDAHPFYRFARQMLGPDAVPKWNFHKYLVDGQGGLVSFSSRVEPLAGELKTAIEQRLTNAPAQRARP
jgi:glutathione peroxidase